jgi:hypothetical protein
MDYGLIETTDIPTRTGKVVLLHLTDIGKQILREKGYQFNQTNGPESLIHEYWKHKAADFYEALVSYKVIYNQNRQKRSSYFQSRDQ